MPNLDWTDLKQSPGRSVGIFDGVIHDTATGIGDRVRVILPAHSVTQPFGPAFWQPRPNAAGGSAPEFPQKGDRCVVALALTNDPGQPEVWILNFWPYESESVGGDPSTPYTPPATVGLSETFTLAASTGITVSTINGVALDGNTHLGYDYELEGIFTGVNVDIYMRPNGSSALRGTSLQYNIFDGGVWGGHVGSWLSRAGLLVASGHFSAATSRILAKGSFITATRGLTYRLMDGYYLSSADADSWLRGVVVSSYAEAGNPNITSLGFNWASGTFTGQLKITRRA